MNRSIIFTICCCFIISFTYAQTDRIATIKNQLESLQIDAPGLSAQADINVSNIALSDFLQAVANAHKINLNISPDLNVYSIKNNFSNATVADILLFACKEYNLTIDFTGNILSIRKYTPTLEKKPHRVIPISYNDNLFSIDLQKDTLYIAFKQIMDTTGKNLVFTPGIENIPLIGYIQNMPFDSAIDKIALSNNLLVTKTRDDYYLFEKNEVFNESTATTNIPQTTKNAQQASNRPQRKARGNFYFEINKTNPITLNVDFENTSIASVIHDIGYELKKNMFTSSPLTEAGITTVKADTISFDLLLNNILENTDYTFKKKDSIYYFGKKDQISLREAVTIPLMHRSIEVMNSSGGSGRKAGRTSYGVSSNGYSNSYSGSYTNANTNRQSSGANNQNVNTSGNISFSSNDTQLESLINMLPEDVTKELDIKIDVELNSFIISGPNQHIERFKDFIAYIDKPVPVILIEVMLLEVNKSATVETGVSWGLGTEPAQTQGGLFPTTDLTLGANTINRIIGGFNGFGSYNLGKVVPEFFAQIKAMETNGDIKIRSAPKLSALNGHRASLSIGETTYYAVTQRDIIGSQNPQTSTITNYYPIDAEFAINIKPLVSGDGQITLDINVIQSNFNGKKVGEDAPPGINSREFNSIIRVKNEDLIILGGLEEKIKNDTGSGVPVLARIPVIKWFFSKKKREDSKKKLTVLIKPTIIN